MLEHLFDRHDRQSSRFDSCCNDFGDWCAALSRALQNEVYTTGMVVKHVGTKADLEALGLKAGGTTGWLKSEAVYQLLLENCYVECHRRMRSLARQLSDELRFKYRKYCTGSTVQIDLDLDLEAN